MLKGEIRSRKSRKNRQLIEPNPRISNMTTVIMI